MLLEENEEKEFSFSQGREYYSVEERVPREYLPTQGPDDSSSTEGVLH